MLLSINHPMIIAEQWDRYTDVEHQTWNTLFTRQNQLLVGCVADETLEGMQYLAEFGQKIPKLSVLNQSLERATGFSAIPVAGFIPEDLFCFTC